MVRVVIFWLVVLFSVSAFGKCTMIGLLGEFNRKSSGATVHFGNEIKRGAKLAVDYLKKENQACVDTLPFDINNSIADIPGAIVEAVNAYDVHLFVGLGTTDKSLASRKVLDKTKSILITPTASGNELTKSNRIITMFPLNDQLAKQLAHVAYKKGARSVLIIYASNSIYSKDMMFAFKKAFEKIGGKVVLSLSQRSGNISLDKHIQKLKELKYSHIFLPLYELDVARVISLLSRNGIQKEYIGSDSWGTYSKLILKLTRNVNFSALVPMIYSPTIKTKTNSYFVKNYMKKFNSKPTDLAAFTFDGVRLYSKMLESCSAEEIRNKTVECLKKSLPFDSITGTIRSSQKLHLDRKVFTILKKGHGDAKETKNR